jgi:hypothetical protein
MNGMALIYSGQEAGLNKRLAFFDKDLIPWQPHPFADMYTTLCHLKIENSALWNGGNGGQFQRVHTTNDETIFAFIREKEEDKIFAVFNLSPGYSGATLLDTLFYGNYADVFTDDTVSFGHESSIALPGWDYRIYQQTSTATGIENDFQIPDEFALEQNYPNPFNPMTTIRYSLSTQSNVDIRIYNVLGQEVRTLINTPMSAGEKSIVWNGKDQLGRNVNSGIYLCRLKIDNHSKSRRMLLLR